MLVSPTSDWRLFRYFLRALGGLAFLADFFVLDLAAEAAPFLVAVAAADFVDFFAPKARAQFAAYFSLDPIRVIVMLVPTQTDSPLASYNS